MAAFLFGCLKRVPFTKRGPTTNLSWAWFKGKSKGSRASRILTNPQYCGQTPTSTSRPSSDNDRIPRARSQRLGHPAQFPLLPVGGRWAKKITPSSAGQWKGEAGKPQGNYTKQRSDSISFAQSTLNMTILEETPEKYWCVCPEN